MTKSDRIKEYNNLNSGYSITAIKSMTAEQLASYKKYNQNNDIYDLYSKPSYSKVDSWNAIIRNYSPIEIIAVQGSCSQYSVILKAANGDILHITKCNNYLVDVI